MCGIAGFTHTVRASDPELIYEALRSIHHRGPDQQGAWSSAQVTLGAVRLKIIDLEGGNQPMHSEDGDVVLVFNGEVYNHSQLRVDLEKRGHRFHSHCDTEVVLRAFLEWGSGSFERLRGMFAFALWQQSTGRLVLVRDRMGIKPLYYARNGSELYFGSELKAVFVHRSLSRTLDPHALNLYLSLNYIPGNHTLVAEIEKLPPGTWLEWRRGDVRVHRYWELEFAPRPIGLSEAKEQLDDLLKSSLREHLISDVPLGVWSSGGIDSSTVLHYAAEVSGRQLKTFSVSFLGRIFDESRYFREVSRRYGTDHHEFDLNAEAELVPTIEQMSYYSDEPSADAGALPVWFLSKMCRSHVTVALSGEGADELFGGYNTYLADRYARLARIVPDSARRIALALARQFPASDDKIGFEYKIKRMLQGSLLPEDQAHYFWNGTFSEKERQRLLAGEYFQHNQLEAGKPEWGSLNRYLYADQKNYLVDDILYKCDRMSMAHSLEVRPPFLDHRIVEFAARLPQTLKIRGSVLKFLLRELMRDKLPSPVLTRPKEGFDIPAHEWFRGVLRPLLQDTLNEQSVHDSGFLNWPEVKRVMDEHFSRRSNYGYHLWGLLTLFLWIRRWRVDPGALSRTQPERLLASN